MTDGRGDLEWVIGDELLQVIARGCDPGIAKAAAVKATRREQPELTWITRTCEAFPPDQRRSDAPFAIHRAVLDINGPEREALLARAILEGWTIRRTRRAVLEARVAAGAYSPPIEDDLDDKLYRGMVQAWNRATPSARDLFLGSAEEADLAEILL